MLAQKADVDVKVFYTWHDGTGAIKDPGFGKQIAWDVPLTDGYEFELVTPSTRFVSRSFRNMDSPGLISAVEDFRPTAVLVIGWNFRSHLRALRYFHGRIPVLFRGDSTLLDRRSGPKKLVRSTLLRWVLGFVDYALSVGTNNTDYFRHYGLTEQQIVDAPHAIDNDRFQGAGKDYDVAAAKLRRELGFGESDTVLLFAGKFETKKRPDRLLRAFLTASQNRDDLRLLFVGSGELEDQLKATAEETSKVQFLPFQNQSRIPVIYRVGDIAVLPSSHNETWGLALNESMASGRPIMATENVGATKDLIVDGMTGFVFPSQGADTEQAARSLQRLPDRQTLLRMGSYCQQFIRQNWSFDVLVSAVQQLVHSQTEIVRG